MTSRTWGPDGSGIPISTANLNGVEADLDKALLTEGTVTTVTTDYTALSTDRVIIAQVGRTLTLPDPTTVATGRSFLVRTTTNLGQTLNIVSAGTSKTIDGNSSAKLPELASARFMSNGAQWVSVGSYGYFQTLSLGLTPDALAIDNAGNITRISGQNTTIMSCGESSLPTSGLQVGALVIERTGIAWVKRNQFGTGTSNLHPLGYTGGVNAKTANYTLDFHDTIVVLNGTSITATLPDPTTQGLNNRMYILKNTNSTSATIVSAGTTKTIDGAASITLAQWGAVKVLCDGSQWLIVSKF